MNTHLPAPASPNVFSSYSSLLVGHLSLCIHHPNPLPSSVIHPQFRHTYIAHHAHRSLFFPFCFISNRIFLVIATLYTFPPPWRHPFPVWYSRNPFFLHTTWSPLQFIPHLRIASTPTLRLWHCSCFIRLVLVAPSIKILNITTPCTVFLRFPPLKSYPTPQLFPPLQIRSVVRARERRSPVGSFDATPYREVSTYALPSTIICLVHSPI